MPENFIIHKLLTIYALSSVAVIITTIILFTNHVFQQYLIDSNTYMYFTFHFTSDKYRKFKHNKIFNNFLKESTEKAC